MSTLGPAYRIETKRLILRCWNPTDAFLLQDAIRESVEHLKPWMPWAHADHKETIQDKVERLRRMRSEFDRGEQLIFGIFNPQETRVLGGAGLHSVTGPGGLEIGYWLHKDFINQGLITEAVAALTRVAFEVHEVDRVEIHCAPQNVRSAAVPKKLGFTHEVTLSRRTLFLEELRDSMIWTLYRSDFLASPASKAEMRMFDAAGRKIK